MAAKTKADVGAPVQHPGLSGWCLAGQHAECSYLACSCTRCGPDVHHVKAGQAPQVLTIDDTGPERTETLAAA